MKALFVIGLACGVSAPAFADTSPTLLIETGPSDNPAYRRVVSIKYLNGAQVTANYKAYNRREFINAPNTTDANAIAQCVRGSATTLSDIKAFERAEQSRSQSGQAPESRTFCVKNISDWTEKNKDLYLDPIFEGMPYVVK